MCEWAFTVQCALDEDIGRGDVTSLAILASDLELAGRIVSKEQGVVAGLEVANLAFRLVDARISMIPQVTDGEAIAPAQILAQVRGPGVGILSAERVALNFLQ